MEEKIISGKFSELLHVAMSHLTVWLKEALSSIDQEKWWQTFVLSSLSYHQRKRVDDKNITQLEELDLAALLKITEKNWYQISQNKKLSMRKKHYVKEMQTIRNRWAHSDMNGLDKDDIYRDIDNIQVFVSLLNANEKVCVEGRFYRWACPCA